MPGPIIPRHNYQQISPMGLETVLQTTDPEDRISRQGFRFVDDWQSSHINNFPSVQASVYDTSNNHANGGYPHRNNYAQPQDNTGYSQSAHDGHTQESYDGGWWQGPNANSGPMS